jgi:RNA polymerase sigma-70 factor (ECF subfamily)
MASTEGFEAFYAATVERLLGQLLPVTGDLHEAEEVVQEAFARASVRWTRLRDYDAPEAWVRRVAFNLALNELRRARRFVAALARVGPPADVPALAADDLDLIAGLGRLPLRHRQVLVLHHLADLPVEQVARELGIPIGTAKSRLRRAREALARELAGRGEVGRAKR